MLIDWINENESVMHALHKAGLLSHTVFFYRNLYLDYSARVIMGNQKTISVLLTSDKFRVSEMTVYRAIRSMTGPSPEVKCNDNSELVDKQ